MYKWEAGAALELIERERLRDDSDITDKINEGTPVSEMLNEVSVDPELQARLITLLGLGPLLDRGFRKLSTGETRKVLITRALSSIPAMVIIDGPFEGLDAQTVPLLDEILHKVSAWTPLILNEGFSRIIRCRIFDSAPENEVKKRPLPFRATRRSISVSTGLPTATA